ncbi:conserved hypothetical protein [Theileria orientalis strain Shintoku]|uniref:Uncharacterized protein n=1 Tax=Theileria orientalis strain Shintoku TaxID=869250 RepID=J4C873_THEOR|nr:conserved hypothetical protein [Theileria orientalis strain Shintoku]PVC51614.1 hypothetical protein MACL_00001406 [Theileria orientalis]BAM40288.1 conserved hypothetical protein [Theileria orientalis strain Shintoku]|eukprot:XP_009690589.1 conserved hypothetical protein [Theileria orientalis strain Shintoku]
MAKRGRKQVFKDSARVVSKSEASNMRKGEKEPSLDQNLIIPLLKLPSVDLCISNTYPITCIKPKVALPYLKELETGKEEAFCESSDPDNSLDGSFGSGSKEEGTKSKLHALRGQLYLMNLLHRIIKIGYYNKREILSLYNFTTKKNTMLHPSFVNDNTVKTLIKSRLSRLSNYKFSRIRPLSHDSQDAASLGSDDALCFDNSTFSMLDTFFIHNKGPVIRRISQPGHDDALSEERMLSNLLKGKLCNGKDCTVFNRFILSILLINKYDFLPPNFINVMLSSRRVSECDF